MLVNTAGGVDAHVTAMIIILVAMCYLAVAALGSRRSGWVMVEVSVVAGGAGLDPTTTLLVMGAGVDRRELGVQHWSSRVSALSF